MSKKPTESTMFEVVKMMEAKDLDVSVTVEDGYFALMGNIPHHVDYASIPYSGGKTIFPLCVCYIHFNKDGNAYSGTADSMMSALSKADEPVAKWRAILAANEVYFASVGNESANAA
jgi:hypothetical protein